MALKRVYLDQRDWVALARQHYGLAHDDAIADALAVVQATSAAGEVSFPLSATHYIETARARDPRRRRRLGAFMKEISRFHTIADAPTLLKGELHNFVCGLAGIEPSRPAVPFGRGIAHAFNESLEYFTDPEVRRRAIVHFGAERVFEMFETELLLGPDRVLPSGGVGLPTREFGQRQLDLERDTTRRINEWGHSTDHAHRFVLVQEVREVMEQFVRAASELRVDVEHIFSSREKLTELVYSLPAKRVICRMRMTAHENSNFRWHINDLNDMAALGTAAAYCDVVVCENQWGDILRRNTDYLNAQVTSNLGDLPRILLG